MNYAIGRIEVHSADEKDHILHRGESDWVIVWRGLQQRPAFRTRERARRVIRRLKKASAILKGL